ncbi:DNA replication licensing factor MCM6-like [Danaus plexippus]|uniref:DNA replication licensing factor MCM6-like n=1 Tax=Danaus plexippus TaxID=13037 RepID=UPI002AAFC5F4|nr:DNA replication licensing factor MCM6-like [Danaus plexippus]
MAAAAVDVRASDFAEEEFANLEQIFLVSLLMFEELQQGYLILQENSAEIPAGSVPRSIDVILTKNLTDKCKPGDKIVLSGCLTAIPDVSSLMKPRELTKDLIRTKLKNERTDQGQSNTGITGLRSLGKFMSKQPFDEEEEYAIAQHLASVELTMNSLGLPLETQELFFKIANSTDTLNKLASSVAPEIFGCENVKKGILLMLVGGVEKSTGKDNLKLRGDINICIIGDPGTAKSQLLKYVHQFATGRAVYAAGFTSTAAGLTVSVHKDPDQGDSVIEAGALMLADQGICCIDEFDKIDNKDMVAIHEAMEQKTISICKAGIQATLNARASILAACNPRYGRYDLTKTFRQNIRLSQPIISRFDLFFTLVDTTDRDALIARHIVNLHMQLDKSNVLQEETALLTSPLLRKYLAVARSCHPAVDVSSRNILVDTYVSMRSDSTYSRKNAYVTVRQLESLLRLSEAIAKLKFSNRVLPVHVKEARNLMQSSFLNLQKNEIILDDDDDSDDNMDDDNNASNKDKTHQEEDSKKNVITINGEEYERISNFIIDHLRAIEIEFMTDKEKPTEAIIAKDDLIAWYIENVADESIGESEHETEQMYRKLSKIISRMVNRDFTLIEEMRDMNVPIEGDTSIVQCVPTLRLHPNLAADFIPNQAPAAHANLPTDFFTEQATNTETNPSWTIDDEAFIDYMYGWTQQ